jgi:cytochrome o ubiquinol oxidase subunit II
MSADLNLQADQPGTYHGLSTHLSGDGFSDMNFKVRALDHAGFDAWMAAARSSGPALDAGRYAQLAKQSIKDPPSTFSSVDPMLYRKIVSQELAPGPGPEPKAIPKTKPDSASNPAGGVLTAGEPSAPHTHAMEH